MEEEEAQRHPPPFVRRILAVAFIATLTIWANHEASKGYEINVLNDASNTPAGRRFGLLFVSNDKASRIIINAGRAVDRILYPDGVNQHQKPIDAVTLRLAAGNLTKKEAIVAVDRISPREFVIHLSSNVMSMRPVDRAVMDAVGRGMARVRLWDGEGASPAALIDGMVEYVSMVAGFAAPASDPGGSGAPESGEGCWARMKPAGVARVLMYGEGRRPKFVARLNRAMREGWHVRMVNDAFGRPLCSSYLSSLALRLGDQSGATSASGRSADRVSWI